MISSQLFNNRPFWVKWTQEGLIQFGSGRQPGRHEILFYSDDNSIPIELIQVSSFEAGVASWEFFSGDRYRIGVE